MEQYERIQQLLKKEPGTKERVPIFVPTVIQAVFDGKTGASLEAILAQFNSVFVQFQGTAKDTRILIPADMRRPGLIITYINAEGETVSERASLHGHADDEHWALDVNWSRIDEFSLSGDIAVSARGTWIINGEDTGIKAVGPKGENGITPWLKEIDNKLHYSYDNVKWTPCSDPLSAQFRNHNNRIQISYDKGKTWKDISDPVATYVRFAATSSTGQDGSIGKLQYSYDKATWHDLSPEFRNYLRIQGYVKTYGNLPTGVPVGTIYGVGPFYEAGDTTKTNPMYQLRVWDGSQWVNNGTFTSISAGIVQETGNSENAVMSQKAVSEKLSELGSELIDISLIKSEKCSLGIEGWFYYENLGCSHKAIDLRLGYNNIKFKSDKDSVVGFVTNSYSTPYNNNDAIPYANGTSRISVKANTLTVLNIPEDAAYFILTTVDGGGNVISYSDIELTAKFVMRQVSGLKKDIYELGEAVINIADLNNESGALGSDSWFYYENLGCSHKAIDLTLGYDKVVITANRFAYIGFLTDSYSPPYSNGDSIPYANNSTRLSVEANTPTTFNIPSDAAYLVLTTVDGGGNIVEYSEVKVLSKKVMQNVCELNKTINKVKDELEYVEIIDMEIDIEISKLTNQKCSLGVSNWFYYSNLGCSHKAVKIEKGYKRFVIAAKQTASIGFVTDSYNPPYANNDTIPYVNGTARIMIDANTPTILDIPNDAAYLILTTVDGGGNLIEYSNVTVKAKILVQDQVDKNTQDIKHIYKTLSDIDRDATANLKGIFSIMTYNIGSWYNGTGYPIPMEEKETYLPIQENIMQRYSPDILLIQEFSNDVVVGNLTSKQFLNSFHLAESDVNGDTWYDGKAIASKYPITNVEVVPFVTKDQHHTCFIKGQIECNGKKVTIVSVHFVIGESSSSLQLDELLENVKNDEYLIIGMDSNIDINTESGKNIFKKVTNAGLKYLNEGIVTVPKQGLAIDNIIISPNIVAKSVLVDTRKSVLGDNADHYPLLAYLEIL